MSTPASTPPGTPSASSATPPPTIQRKRRGMGVWIAVAVVIVVIVIVVGLGVGLGWFKTSSSSKASTACGPGSTATSAPGATDFKGEGSTLVAPLMDQWATSYGNGAQLTYDPAGSSSGVTAITDKVVDFGASDYPLTTTQLNAIPGVVTIPESVGAVVPIYYVPGIVYPTGVSSLNFNGSVLAQMFDGTITNWNNPALQALNPGVSFPTATILPVHRTGGSGTTFIFTSFLTADSSAWASSYGKSPVWPTTITVGTSASGNGGEADTVGTTPDTLGYVDLNYALNSASSVGIGNVQNPSLAFIRASVVDTVSALHDLSPTLPTGTQTWYNVSYLNAPGKTDYPIVGLTYILTYSDLSSAFSSYSLANAENLVDFIHWAITVGQSWSAPLYYAPISSGLLSIDNATLNSFTFSGASIPVCVPTSGSAPA